VDYGFTAHLEDELDDISNGTREWVPVMDEFWGDFHTRLEEKGKVERGCAIGEDCPQCGKPLLMQASKRGLFLGCSGYPACDYTRPFGEPVDSGEQVLGTDPASGLPVRLLNGRYGWYVQLGDAPEKPAATTKGKAKAPAPPKPRRASWPKDRPVETADLATALTLLSLPRELGHHPQTGKPIVANIGRFGPYLLHDGKFKSIPKDLSPYDIALDKALEVLAAPYARGGGDTGRELGAHPADGKAVTVKAGRYGPYVSHGKLNATLPKDLAPESITLDEALALLAAKAEKDKAKPPKGKAK
jgi:DNA topoisomerase-1